MNKNDLSLYPFIPLMDEAAEPLSTKVTDEELAEAITDEYGVMYSKDGRKLLRATDHSLRGIYAIRMGD